MTCRAALLLAIVGLSACTTPTEPATDTDTEPVTETEPTQTEPTETEPTTPVSLMAGYEIVSTEGTHPGGTSACIESTCPSGSVALGGGGFWEAAIALDNNRALATDDWGLCGYADAEATWIVHAVCVDDNPDLAHEVIEVESTAPGLTSTCVTATCPDGKKVVGGGGFFAGTLNLDNIRPMDDQSFTVCGYAFETSQYVAQAVCADIPDEDYLIVSEVGQHPGQTSACVAATCPDGFVAVGGGGRWEIGAGMEPDNSGVNPDEWVICGWSDQPSEITTDVICVRE